MFPFNWISRWIARPADVSVIRNSSKWPVGGALPVGDLRNGKRKKSWMREKKEKRRKKILLVSERCICTRCQVGYRIRHSRKKKLMPLMHSNVFFIRLRTFIKNSWSALKKPALLSEDFECPFRCKILTFNDTQSQSVGYFLLAPMAVTVLYGMMGFFYFMYRRPTGFFVLFFCWLVVFEYFFISCTIFRMYIVHGAISNGTGCRQVEQEQR